MALEGDPNQKGKKQPAKKEGSKGEGGGLAATADKFMGNFFGGNQTGAVPGTLKPVPAALKPSPTLTEREQREVSTQH